jgi:hypothetical protein
VLACRRVGVSALFRIRSVLSLRHSCRPATYSRQTDSKQTDSRRTNSIRPHPRKRKNFVDPLPYSWNPSSPLPAAAPSPSQPHPQAAASPAKPGLLICLCSTRRRCCPMPPAEWLHYSPCLILSPKRRRRLSRPPPRPLASFASSPQIGHATWQPFPQSA